MQKCCYLYEVPSEVLRRLVRTTATYTLSDNDPITSVRVLETTETRDEEDGSVDDDYVYFYVAMSFGFIDMKSSTKTSLTSSERRNVNPVVKTFVLQLLWTYRHSNALPSLSRVEQILIRNISNLIDTGFQPVIPEYLSIYLMAFLGIFFRMVYKCELKTNEKYLPLLKHHRLDLHIMVDPTMHLILKHPEPMFLSQSESPSFTTIQKNRRSVTLMVRDVACICERYHTKRVVQCFDATLLVRDVPLM
ncbi:hypothetical protein ANN_27367 [Periplaneta americana]|uniref:Uncharacterized protein n=1 Tax=Periplaneta americana TaxID=6978 RepID=A0ABQ8RXU0_PERAM|nr:hypothetical protein ANN_27367 [Periplaneta americana]